mgnify:CR=1 FL=1
MLIILALATHHFLSDKTLDELDTTTVSSRLAAIIDYIFMKVCESVTQHAVTWNHGFVPPFRTDDPVSHSKSYCPVFSHLT